jgi:hypothetical protein
VILAEVSPVRSPAEIADLKARADLAALMQQDGREVVKEGGRLKVCCPIHTERTPSCVIFDDNKFHCFGCHAHGDVIEYLTKVRGLSFDKACEALGAAPQRATPAKVNSRRRYDVIMPVPANAPRHNWRLATRNLGDPTACWWYNSPDACHRLMVVVRYPVLDGGRPKLDADGNPEKTCRAWCWARDLSDHSTGWACTRPSDHLPLYGLDRLAAKPDAPVLIVEGEKSADAGQDYLPHHAVITWCGGASNVEKRDRIDWSPLAGRDVILWPDYDKPGALAMMHVREHLLAINARVRVVDLRRLATKPKGWDVADGTRDDAEICVELAV